MLRLGKILVICFFVLSAEIISAQENCFVTFSGQVLSEDEHLAAAICEYLHT